MKELEVRQAKPEFITRLMNLVANTPLHPQWLVLRHKRKNMLRLSSQIKGTTLDIGCSDKAVRDHLSADVSYFGLDYYQTAMAWYESRPDVFGDAQQLPVREQSVDTCLLLSVLEHLPEPEACMHEIHRVLKPGGRLLLRVPFLYPVHDAPLDFHRWSIFGLRHLAKKHGFQIQSERSSLCPIETVALLGNLASGGMVLQWFRQKNPLSLLVLLLPFQIVLCNFLAWVFARLPGDSLLMSNEHYCVWIKEDRSG